MRPWQPGPRPEGLFAVFSLMRTPMNTNTSDDSNQMIVPALALLVQIGCAHWSPVPGSSPIAVRGSLADVRTATGTYDGYIVERNCINPGCIGVRGTGTADYPGLENHIGKGDVNAYMEAVGAYRRDLLRAIGNPPSFVSSAFGQACWGQGMLLGTSDSAEIDPAITGIGSFLREHNLKEQVAICLGADSLDARGNVSDR